MGELEFWVWATAGLEDEWNVWVCIAQLMLTWGKAGLFNESACWESQAAVLEVTQF